MGLLLVFIIGLISIQYTESNGKFQLSILKLINLHNDQCCGNIRRKAYQGISSTQCSTKCCTMFKLYLQNEHSDGKRYLANTTTLVRGSVLSNDDDGLLEIPFTFPWMRRFALSLEIFVHDHDKERNTLIENTNYSGILLPGNKWQTLSRRSANTRITYQIRVECSANYYEEFCTKYCKPRNDKFGHYYCSGNGDRVCANGWNGDYCDKVVCKSGCHPVHGRCSVPGECNCRPGWKGELCDQCVPYPGCKNGSCNGEPGRCLCNNQWGGLLCDQFLDQTYCTAHKPCLNGGSCFNLNPNQYRCSCPEGYSGINCEVIHKNANSVYIQGLCTWNNQYYANNATWQDRCNICTCEDSIVKCTKLWCGPENCLSGQLVVTGSLKVCVPLSIENCLLKPCRPWGEFRTLTSNGLQSSNSHSMYPLETKCWPNHPLLIQNLCSRLQIVLDRTKLPTGTTLESLCAALRTVLAHHLSSRKLYDDLFLLCGPKNEKGPKIIVELTLSTSEELVSNIVDEATMMLNDFLRNNQTTEAELMAVVDVNIEDSAPKSPSDNISLLLIGSVLTLIFIVCLITNLVVVCYLRQDSSSFAEFNLSNVQQYNRNHVEEITNNLQNKKKLTKDTNTINDTDFSGPSKWQSNRAASFGNIIEVQRNNLKRPNDKRFPYSTNGLNNCHEDLFL